MAKRLVRLQKPLTWNDLQESVNATRTPRPIVPALPTPSIGSRFDSKKQQETPRQFTNPSSRREMPLAPFSTLNVQYKTKHEANEKIW
jgi:hypothetical protein